MGFPKHIVGFPLTNSQVPLAGLSYKMYMLGCHQPVIEANEGFQGSPTKNLKTGGGH